MEGSNREGLAPENNIASSLCQGGEGKGTGSYSAVPEGKGSTNLLFFPADQPGTGPRAWSVTFPHQLGGMEGPEHVRVFFGGGKLFMKHGG